MNKNLDILLERFKAVIEGEPVSRPTGDFKTYAISNFRGGIGKSTLAFNLAWELSRTKKTLLMDVCPQANFSQLLIGEDLANCKTSIYDALLPKVMAGIPDVEIGDILVSVPPSCTPFKGGHGVYCVPGSKELFLFPSLLYTQLSTAMNLGSRKVETSRKILHALEEVCKTASAHIKSQTTIIDTSPFFGGATHLAWVAADALIIPVRVDQQSMDALKLTLSMLRNVDMDFLRLNSQAQITKKPKVHGVVMTHCGWNRQAAFTPDRSTQSYLTQVISIVDEYADLFSSTNPIECIHMLDDFHSAGRISGSKRIPLAKLSIGESHTIEGQRLEVNQSLTRYQRELKSLALTL